MNIQEDEETVAPVPEETPAQPSLEDREGSAAPEEAAPTTTEETGESRPGQANGSSFVTMAVGIARQAAVQAYSTTKDVFHTLQARNQYQPPNSEWTPPNNNWTPPQEQWTPPPEWTPPTESEPANQRRATPMDTLIEMGFANRELNVRLLEKHDNDLDKVIGELIQSSDNSWTEARH